MSKQLSERWSLQLKVQHNALLERSNTLLKDTVKQMVAEKQADWDDFIDPVLALFRTSVNPATKFTPYCLMFSRKPSMPGEVGLPTRIAHDSYHKLTFHLSRFSSRSLPLS